MRISGIKPTTFMQPIGRVFGAGIFTLALLINSLPLAVGQDAKYEQEPALHSANISGSGARVTSPNVPVNLVPNGAAVVTSDGSDGATLRVVDPSLFGTMWNNLSNRAPNFVATTGQMPLLHSWNMTDFNSSSGTPNFQAMQSAAVTGDGSAIYVATTGFILGSNNTINKTPNIYRIGPGTSTTPVRLTTLNSYVANVFIRRGIGGIDIDEIHQVLYASNIADGIIYRRRLADGQPAGTFGTPEVTFDPINTYQLGNTQLPPYGDRVLAVAYNRIENRVYYSIWGRDLDTSTGANTIRSVGLTATGAFDPPTDRLEITIPNSVSPVADIEFNAGCNRMLLAEKSLIEVSGAIDRGTQPARALEYVGSGGAWTPDPVVFLGGTQKYYVGVPNGTNSSGGAAFGYSSLHVSTGVISGDENFVMFTGNALRSDSTHVYGLQWSPKSGGAAGGITFSNSLIADLNYDTTAPNQFAYGDVDVCRSHAPTAATANIAGTVLSSGGLPLANVYMTMTDMAGQTRTAVTNPFGNYSFAEVPTGETYVVTASAKGKSFDPQIVLLTGDMLVNFTAY